jgi:hypothetical protein
MRRAIEIETGRCVEPHEVHGAWGFYCGYCFAEVHLRAGNHNRPHFAHNPNLVRVGECPDYHENDGAGVYGPYDRVHALNGRPALRFRMSAEQNGELEAILPRLAAERIPGDLRRRTIQLLVGGDPIKTLPAASLAGEERERSLRFTLRSGLVTLRLDGEAANDSPETAELRRMFEAPLLDLGPATILVFSTADGLWLDPGEALHAGDEYYLMAGPGVKGPIPDGAANELKLHYEFVALAGGWRVWRVRVPAPLTDAVRAWGRGSLRRLIASPRSFVASTVTESSFFLLPQPLAGREGALTIHPPVGALAQRPCRLVWDLPWQDVRASVRTEGSRRLVQVCGTRDEARETSYGPAWFVGVDTLGWGGEVQLSTMSSAGGKDSAFVPRIRTAVMTSSQLRERLRSAEAISLARILAPWFEADIVLAKKLPPIGSTVFLKAA